MLGGLLELASAWRARAERALLERRWRRLRARGMTIGEDVLLPGSTWIDTAHCHLITIGDHTGFGERCSILAHDAQMDEFLDAARIGRVVIHPSCHVGAGTIVLAGVEIGPRTIVGAGSVVSRSLPPDTVCAGSPAKPICSLDEYLDRHRATIAASPGFPYAGVVAGALTPARRREMAAAVAAGEAYVVGGRSAELQGAGGTLRTPAGPETLRRARETLQRERRRDAGDSTPDETLSRERREPAAPTAPRPDGSSRGAGG